MSVWTVETGAYSDYRVVGIFSTRVAAERMAESLGLLPSESVRERPLDPGVDRINAGLRLFGLVIDDDGCVVNDWRLGYASDEDLSDPRPERAWISETNAYDRRPQLRMWIWAKSASHAKKAIQDRRRALMASGAWDGRGEIGDGVEL